MCLVRLWPLRTTCTIHTYTHTHTDLIETVCVVAVVFTDAAFVVAVFVGAGCASIVCGRY